MIRRSFVLLFVLALLPFQSAAQQSENEETKYLSQTRQLTFEGRRAGEGYFHPSGEKLIFQSEREPGNPFYQIYILDLTTGDTHRVSPGKGKTTCAFFRPGTDKVLFASTHIDKETDRLQKEEIEFRESGKERRYSWDYDEFYDIFEANQDGTGIRPLTSARGYDAEGSYSPDGSKIAFTSMRDAYPIESLSESERKIANLDLSYFGEIYIMDADGSNQRRLTNNPGYDGGPFFSPDGERIIWRRFTPDGMQADVYTMKLDGSDVRRLTEFEAMSWAPYFHPSGDYVIFASNKLGFENFELFIVDAMGEKEPVRVSFTEGFDGLPVFHPSGDRLVWTSTRHGSGREGGQLYMARWNDAAARKALELSPERSAGSEIASAEDAKPADFRADVEYLASGKLEGRLTGTEGERDAAKYIEQRMKAAGLRPFGERSFTSAFEFTSGVSAGDDNKLEVWQVDANPHIPLEERMVDARKEREFMLGENFAPLSLSSEGEAHGLLAFAGYGLVVPGEDGKLAYDSYEGIDVKDRIVLVLRYVPENVSPEQRQVYNRYAALRYKALVARERGAKGILIVTGPNSPNADALVPLGLDAGGASSDIFAASIDIDTANRLLALSRREIGGLQSELDTGEKRTAFAVEDTVVKMKIELDKQTREGLNVLGVLPPQGGIKDNTEFVVIGGHYDHLGRGASGNSLARKGEEDAIHYGADDNASGIAALLKIAEDMASSPRTRDRAVVFAAWSGEELGLLGSNDFVKDPPVALERIVGYLNMDMVGRVRDNKLAVQGVGSSADWKSLIEKKNVLAGFSLSLTSDPYLPTDSMAFYLKNVPGLQFFSGSHDDYHRPSDTPEKINYEGIERVADFVRSIAEELATAPTRPIYAKVEPTASQSGGGRDTLRAYVGTIPDYAEEIQGVKLAGVREGGPADKAGIKGGDIVVEFGGQKIANIYDYTYALDAVKIGEPLKVVVEREGKRVELTVTPEARK